MNEINRERFEAWLFSQEPSREFDYCNVEGGCAICQFVRETTSWKYAVGGGDAVHKSFGEFFEIKMELPKWARRAYKGVLEVEPLTIANMQARYISLFGDPRIVDEPAQATPPLIHASGLA